MEGGRKVFDIAAAVLTGDNVFDLMWYYAMLLPKQTGPSASIRARTCG